MQALELLARISVTELENVAVKKYTTYQKFVVIILQLKLRIIFPTAIFMED